MELPCFLGIDIGTQGARVALLDAAGALVGSGAEAFPLTADARQQQSPEYWWTACLSSLKRVMASCPSSVKHGGIKAVAVTSTSGTVIPVDGEGRPLHQALMYSDKRSASAGERCRETALHYHPKGYRFFNASSGLSKMVWFVQQFPDKADHIAQWIHAADYITGRLCGNWHVTDYTNALKSGYDLEALQWPAYLWEHLPLRKDWLQQVVPSGYPVGRMLPGLKAVLGLSGDISVMAGITDGCASQIASGAVGPGQWNTTIGTTLVIKGVTGQPISDAGGRLYSHRHPDSDRVAETGWMPGGASNTGADWITGTFSRRLDVLNREALALLPTGQLAWPLVQRGERFPFFAADARGFGPEGLSLPLRYTANLEGVAYIERMAYEMIGRLSGEQIGGVYTAGGGSNSEPWLVIRSNVLHLPLYKMKYVTGAVGAAMLAAARSHFGTVGAAVSALARVEKVIQPNTALADRYETDYGRFVSALRSRGYLNE